MNRYKIIPHCGIATYKAPGVRAHRLGLSTGRVWRVLKKRPALPRVGADVDPMPEMQPAVSALLSLLCVLLLVAGGLVLVRP